MYLNKYNINHSHCFVSKKNKQTSLLKNGFLSLAQNSVLVNSLAVNHNTFLNNENLRGSRVLCNTSPLSVTPQAPKWQLHSGLKALWGPSGQRLFPYPPGPSGPFGATALKMPKGPFGPYALRPQRALWAYKAVPLWAEGRRLSLPFGPEGWCFTPTRRVSLSQTLSTALRAKGWAQRALKGPEGPLGPGGPLGFFKSKRPPQSPFGAAASYTDKDKVVSITYEEIGLFPRSFSRVLDRFLKQLFSDVDNLVIQEYRFYRYLFLTTIKTIFVLFFVPFVVNFIAKNYVVKPITEYFWNTSHPEIFLSSYEQKRAFAELEKFEEKLYFEALVEAYPGHGKVTIKQAEHSSQLTLDYSPTFRLKNAQGAEGRRLSALREDIANPSAPVTPASGETNTLVGAPFKQYTALGDPSGPKGIFKQRVYISQYMPFGPEGRAKLYQEKTIELALYYNNHSIEAWTNFFADLLSLCTLLYLLITLEIQINITKSFLLEVFFGLDDSKKSLLILLVTDLLVGYHSSNLWELFFEFIFNHYGIPESQTGIFLLVATLPVLLDVLFKYLIFRHLNRSSPATVATYQAIIE